MSGVSRRNLLAAGVSGVVGLGLGLAGGYFLSPEKQVTRTVEITRQVGGTTVTQTVTQPVTTTITQTVPAGVKPIRIGVSVPLTGWFAATGKELETGYKAWAERVNKRGGILGRPVELVILDDASDAKNTVSNYKRLLEVEKVDFLFGPGGPSATIVAALPILEEARMPSFYSSVSLRPWTQGFRYGFSAFSSSEKWAKPAIDAFLSFAPDVKTIGLIAQASEFPLDMMSAAKSYAEKKGLEVVMEEQYPTDITTFVPLLEKLKTLKPDILFATGGPSHCILLTRQMKETGFWPKIYYFTLGPYNPAVIEALGRDIDYVYTTVQWLPYPFIKDYEVKEFTEVATRLGGVMPTYSTWVTYVIGRMFEEAVYRAGSFDKDKIRDAMFDIAKDGIRVAGVRIWINPSAINPQQNQEEGIIIQIQNRQYTVIWPPELATGKPIYPAPSWSERR
jgi:branched-chain amino acid transport system substrate-binding protein